MGIRFLASLLLVLGAASGGGERVEVTASRDGFRPRVINVRRGETVQLLLGSSDGEHCFAVDVFRIEKRILPGRSTTVDLTPDRVGAFPFYCCLETGKAAEVERGRLIVTE